MFATRRQLDELTRELQRLRFIVNHLRRDLNLARGQLHALEGWGDDLIKTRQISDADPRFFDRQFLNRHEPDGQQLEPHALEREPACGPSLPAFRTDEAPESERAQAEGPEDSGVRRRLG